MCFYKRFRIKRLTKKIKSYQYNRTHHQSSPDALKKEIALYHKLAAIYATLQGKKKFPYARLQALESYRAAAALDDAEAQYRLGSSLLEEAKFREKLQENEIFASQSNERWMRQLYDEALAYLTAAEKQNYVAAKRLYGLCYIYGWGVAPDKHKGFELVVASIEQENSWDKVPQIFASIGLNKPEFYSALTQHRHKS